MGWFYNGALLDMNRWGEHQHIYVKRITRLKRWLENVLTNIYNWRIKYNLNVQNTRIILNPHIKITFIVLLQ